VKYSHPEAVKFDIGIYFESNGHGTIVFKQEVLDSIDSILEKGGDQLEDKDLKTNLTLFKTFLN